MATLREEVRVNTPADRVWDAARDLGALHTRLVPGFVTNTVLDGDARIVTFGNGMVVREPIVSVDDERRRLAWTATGASTTHYNAVLEVFADGDGCRVVWTIDLLPNSVAPTISAMQRQGLATLKATLDRA
jgi:hypothetical protein